MASDPYWYWYWFLAGNDGSGIAVNATETGGHISAQYMAADKDKNILISGSFVTLDLDTTYKIEYKIDGQQVSVYLDDVLVATGASLLNDPFEGLAAGVYTLGGLSPNTIETMTEAIGTATPPSIEWESTEAGFDFTDIASVEFTDGTIVTQEGLTAEVTTISDITAGSTLAGGEYFTISSTSKDYYVWYTIDAAGADPAPSGLFIEGIPVALLSTDTANGVAVKVAAAMDGTVFDVPAPAGTTIVVTNVVLGEAVNEAADHDTGWTFNAVRGTETITFKELVADGMGVGDTPTFLYTIPTTISDGAFFYEDLFWSWAVTSDESLVLTDTMSIVLGLMISDWITLIDTQTNNWNGQDIINDTLNLWDLAQSAQLYTASIDESLVMTDTALLKLTITVLENLGFTELVTALKTMASTVDESVVLTDSASPALSLLIQEALSAVDVVSVVTTFLGSISDALGIADTVAPIKRAYPSISESLTFTETVSNQGTFYSVVYDTLAMNITVEMNGEFYECYVLNTPKFMPSMYSGYNFNSFCIFENRAFGANDTGIFELTGDTDAGATIHTGAILSETDFGIPNKKKFRRGYLGITGTSPVMVFETEDGTRQAYSIDTEGKVVASSELKSKMWKLSISDFDELDTIKLLPIILTK